MDELRLVRWQDDGSIGRTLGTLTLRGDTIEATGEAVALLDQLRRRSRLPDPRLWAYLVEHGYSNGYTGLSAA